MAKNGANPLLDAALDFARRGWPVFPCNPKNKQPLLAAQRDASGKAVKGTGGVSAARTDEATIRGWWLKWPMAQVGLACGFGRLFVLDFDPRHDEATGEEFTLERLKGEVEAQIGCALPRTLAARTQSGGVHLYLTWPDDGGPEIRNRGNLPLHVDVRGRGGYVIAPPSFMEDGKQYRWLHQAGPGEAEIVEAPAALVATLRAPKARPQADVAADQAAAADPPPPRFLRPAGDRGDPSEGSDDPVRRYALAALEAECTELARAPVGKRNIEINTSAFRIGQLVGAGALGLTEARNALENVVAGMIASGGGDYEAGCKTVDNGLVAGQGSPRDLADVREQAARRAEQYRDRSPPRAAPSSARSANLAPFRSGRHDGEPEAAGSGEPLTDAEQARFAKAAAAWFLRRLEHAEPNAKSIKAIAWGAGRRCAAGLIDEGAAKEAIWGVSELIPDVSHADVDRAFEEGAARGFDPGPARLLERCLAYPLTDFGIGERFRDRFGADFRFTTAKGWLGWDSRRWKVLDQEKDVPPAEVIAAVFETVRAIQAEARHVRETGVRWDLVKEGKDRRLDLDDQGNPHGLDRWIPKGKDFELLSAKIAAFGRTSETAGKPAAIANLARRWLTLPIEDFDVDPLSINVLNGTLRFAREKLPDGTCRASYRLTRHRREDMNTRLAPVEFDPDAKAPVYDGFFAWAHPEEATRRYLHCIAGYGFTGDTSEQKLWFHYGLGANGKSTWMDQLAEVAGDYSGSIGIETFLDQGIKKRGEQASPDLARLGGVRFLRSSEPERGSKLNEALVKAATGGEPMPVRALHRGFFDLRPLFKLHIGGNYKPDIPGTDEGIWRRMKLVPWNSHVADADRDEALPARLRAEAAGVFNHIVAGLLDWLANGLVEPDAVKAATAAYRDDSDPLARFLRLCTVADPNSRVQSSHLHEVFVAWARAAGETEWKNKGFSQAMTNKGFKKKASDGMQWIGLKLIRAASDFVDAEGNVLALSEDMAGPVRPPGEASPETPWPPWPSDLPLPDDGYGDL